jgi:hypothetical protein
MSTSTIQDIEKIVSFFDDCLENNNCCRSLYCSTCGGVYHAIKSKMTDEIMSLLHTILGEISYEQLFYFGNYMSLIEALERKAYQQINRKRIYDIDQDDLSKVDHYLIEARHYYSLDDELFKELLEHAIEMAISNRSKSLCETLIIIFKNEIVKYSRIVDLALEFAKSDKQMQRVLFNCVRESIPEVRKYSKEAEGFYCAGNVFPTIYSTKELSELRLRYLKSD